MYKVIVFSPTNPEEAMDFLNKKYDERWEFVTCQGCYYYFKKRTIL